MRARWPVSAGRSHIRFRFVTRYRGVGGFRGLGFGISVLYLQIDMWII